MAFGTGESLDTIVKRAKLPISVSYVRANHKQRRAGAKDTFLLAWPGNARVRTAYAYRDDEKAATQTYFNLCQSLSPQSSSAASHSPDAADAGGPSSTGPAGDLPPRSPAPVSPAAEASPERTAGCCGNSAVGNATATPAPSLSRLA